MRRETVALGEWKNLSTGQEANFSNETSVGDELKCTGNGMRVPVGDPGYHEAECDLGRLGIITSTFTGELDDVRWLRLEPCRRGVAVCDEHRSLNADKEESGGAQPQLRNIKRSRRDSKH